MFRINCNEIRLGYAQKYQLIVEKEIKLIAHKAKDKNYELTSQFGHMTEKIKKPPQTIDELTDLRNFIKDCGPDIEKKKKEIDDCMKVYKILDDFNFEMGVVDLNAKWDLYGAPKRLVKLMEERTVELDKLKETMIKEMEQDQEDFEEMLDNLELTVGGFDANVKLDKYMDIAHEASNIDDKIKDCLDAAKTFNSREYLVGKETTDYSRLNKLAKDFVPYSSLWRTASISTMKFNTCDQGWVGRLEKIIKGSFKDVGKGWFNINESSKPTYEFGKLKKFLMLVNFMMQDTVLNMCKTSVHEFVDYILLFIPDETYISSAAVVTNKFKRLEGMEMNVEDDDIPLREDDLEGVKETKNVINKMFAKDCNPEPLF